MLAGHAMLTTLAIGLLGNVFTDQELFHNNMQKAFDTNGVTVIYDLTTATDSVKFLKFAFKERIPFSFVNVDNTFAHMKPHDFAKQIIVMCNYTNMEFIIRNFTGKKMMVLPYVWVFVTDEDLGPIFTDDTLGSVIAASHKANKITLYYKGCRGKNVTKLSEVALEKVMSFEGLLLDLKPLHGCTLSVVVLNQNPLSMYDGENAYGVDIAALRVLAEATGQKLLFVKSKDHMFGEPTKDGWTGNLGVLERNEQDVAVPFFMLTRDRSRSFSTSEFMHHSYWVGLVKTRPIFSAAGVFKPFSLGIWMITTIASTALAICYMFSSKLQLKSWKQMQISEQLLYFLDKGFHAWTAFLQQESRPKGDFTSARMLLLTISTTSLIIFTAYSSVLFAVLSSTELDIPFRSMETFIENGRFLPLFESTAIAMGVQNSSRFKSFRDLYQKFLVPYRSICEPETHKVAMETLNKKEKFVYFLIKDVALSEVAENCQFAIAVDNAAIATFHIHYRKGFVHSRYIDPFIMKIRESGIISRIYKGAIMSSQTCSHSNMDLGMEIMYYPFVILGIGIFISFSFLFAEILLYRTSNAHMQ